MGQYEKLRAHTSKIDKQIDSFSRVEIRILEIFWDKKLFSELFLSCFISNISFKIRKNSVEISNILVKITIILIELQSFRSKFKILGHNLQNFGRNRRDICRNL